MPAAISRSNGHWTPTNNMERYVVDNLSSPLATAITLRAVLSGGVAQAYEARKSSSVEAHK